MGLVLRHKLLVGVVALVAAASGGGAYAATQSSTNPRQVFLNDVARRLGVSPARLRAALKGALIDQLNAAVKRGQLTQAQANRIEQRLQRRARFPFVLAPGDRIGPLARPFLAAGALGSAANYLGLSDAQLFKDLRSGESLAQIAKTQGKSVSGLEQAIVSAETTRLNQLESKGLIPKALEQRLLSRLSRRIGRLVNGSHFGPFFMPPPFLRDVPPPGAIAPPAAGAAIAPPSGALAPAPPGT
jgi:hypothetical protein